MNYHHLSKITKKIIYLFIYLFIKNYTLYSNLPRLSFLPTYFLLSSTTLHRKKKGRVRLESLRRAGADWADTGNQIRAGPEACWFALLLRPVPLFSTLAFFPCSRSKHDDDDDDDDDDVERFGLRTMEQVSWIKCKSLVRTCSCSCSSKNYFLILCALFSPRLDTFTARLEYAFFPLRKTEELNLETRSSLSRTLLVLVKGTFGMISTVCCRYVLTRN